MKKLVIALCLAVTAVLAARADIKVVSLQGDVKVRHGAEEEWRTVAVGDVIKPEDSMRSGLGASVSLLVDEDKKLSLPEMVIVDCSDLRTLTQEELLLKLAMEGIRSLPPQKRDGGISVPRTTTVHGSRSESGSVVHPGNKEGYVMLLNGTKVLHRSAFYATMVLRAKEIFRLSPELKKRYDVRLLMADAFEKMDLKSEALGEYTSLSKERLPVNTRSVVEGKIAELRKGEAR